MNPTDKNARSEQAEIDASAKWPVLVFFASAIAWLILGGALQLIANIQLHTPSLVARNAQLVYQQAVVQRTMPLNNATQMTDAERALLKRWYEAGAKTE